MDKIVLIEYADMKEEIKDLQHRIADGRKELDRLNETVVADVVTCGKKGKRTLKTVKIEGRPTMAIIRKNELLKQRLLQMELLEIELLEKQNQVEQYIEQIERSELRIIFRLYYIDNLNWVQVAHRLNDIFPKKKTAYTADSCRCKHNRFLEKS